MVFKNLCVLVLWMKVAFALEGLSKIGTNKSDRNQYNDNGYHSKQDKNMHQQKLRNVLSYSSNHMTIFEIPPYKYKLLSSVLPRIKKTGCPKLAIQRSLDVLYFSDHNILR